MSRVCTALMEHRKYTSYEGRRQMLYRTLAPYNGIKDESVVIIGRIRKACVQSPSGIMHLAGERSHRVPVASRREEPPHVGRPL